MKDAAGEGGGRTNADVIGGNLGFVGAMLSLNSGIEGPVGMTSVSKAGITLACFFGERGPNPDERRDTRVVFFSALVRAPLLLTLCDTLRGDLRGEWGGSLSMSSCTEIITASGATCEDVDAIGWVASPSIFSTCQDRFSSKKRIR